MADEIKIRVATPDDAPALLKIYAPYVKNTSITYEYDVPSEEEFRRRIESTLRRYPYLVLEREGDILGYAYAGPLHSRPAYDWAVETSIYLDQNARGGGLGRKLHDALEAVLREQGFLNMNACIAYPEVEDEYLTKTARNSTRISATEWSAASQNADINSTAGTAWFGWRSLSASILKISRRSSRSHR